jgi:hypothetical protein
MSRPIGQRGRSTRLLFEHPEPMMTDEELDRSEELSLYDDFFELAQLRD